MWEHILRIHPLLASINPIIVVDTTLAHRQTAIEPTTFDPTSSVPERVPAFLSTYRRDHVMKQFMEYGDINYIVDTSYIINGLFATFGTEPSDFSTLAMTINDRRFVPCVDTDSNLINGAPFRNEIRTV